MIKALKLGLKRKEETWPFVKTQSLTSFNVACEEDIFIFARPKHNLFPSYFLMAVVDFVVSREKTCLASCYGSLP